MGSTGHVVVVFLLYSAAMCILPLFTFFAVQRILKEEFHVTGFANRAWSLISAVIVVNIIIMAYAWRAYKQEVHDETVEGSAPVGLTKSDLELKKSD